MDVEFLEQLSEHLAAPDPPDLPPRGFRLTQEGDPERFELLRWQPMVYTQLLLQDRANERLDDGLLV